MENYSIEKSLKDESFRKMKDLKGKAGYKEKER